MVGVVEGFRGALLGTGQMIGPTFIASVMVMIFVFITGIFYFRRMEKRFADVI